MTILSPEIPSLRFLRPVSMTTDLRVQQLSCPLESVTVRLWTPLFLRMNLKCKVVDKNDGMMMDGKIRLYE